MKTQEITVYRIFDPLDGELVLATESFGEAMEYHEKGFEVHEFHTVKWQPKPQTKTSTTVVIEW